VETIASITFIIATIAVIAIIIFTTNTIAD